MHINRREIFLQYSIAYFNGGNINLQNLHRTCIGLAYVKLRVSEDAVIDFTKASGAYLNRDKDYFHISSPCLKNVGKL